MTKEELTERLDRLKREKSQLIASVNAYDGAIQECLYWLGKLKEDEKEGGK